MEKKLLELAVDIVKSQASVRVMSQEDVESALVRYYNVLQRMQKAEADAGTVVLERGRYGPLVPAQGPLPGVDPRSSIGDDKVTCLECGGEFRQLTANHLQSHHLSPREYKKKWGFPLKQPLAAKMLTSLRSRSAKKRGLPKKLQEYLDHRQQKKRAVNSKVS